MSVTAHSIYSMAKVSELVCVYILYNYTCIYDLVCDSHNAWVNFSSLSGKISAGQHRERCVLHPEFDV